MEQFLPERTTERQVKACSRKRQAAFDPAGADSPPVFALGLRVKGPRFAKSRDQFFFFFVFAMVTFFASLVLAVCTTCLFQMCSQ